jgi:hypothetical protein
MDIDLVFWLLGVSLTRPTVSFDILPSITGTSKIIKLVLVQIKHANDGTRLIQLPSDKSIMPGSLQRISYPLYSFVHRP